MAKILAVYGSPRREGNTSLLLRECVKGVRETGAQVEEVFLRDLRMSPCLEIYGCRKTGRCVIQDDFQYLYDRILSCDGVFLATPVFFYSVSAQTKIFMDRCQSLWVKKYWLEKPGERAEKPVRKGLFVSAGATKGRRLFEGMLLSIPSSGGPSFTAAWTRREMS
jgi:multimeric flavodoxin WrbA